MENLMRRRQFMPALLATAGLACTAASAAGVGEAEAGSGVRGMLERAAIAAVGTLGHSDGFLGNPKVRIPLPPPLEEAAKLLKATGQQKRVDELVTAMNRAAEAAMPLARDLLVKTVKAISISDAIRTAARQTTTGETQAGSLGKAIVQALAELGFVKPGAKAPSGPTPAAVRHKFP